MKVALIHDDFYQWGGAEKLFTVFVEMFPEAPIFTIGYLPVTTPPEIKKRIVSAPANKLHLSPKLYKLFSPLFPMFIESLNLDSFDLVISSTARFAHGVITKPTTKHIAYVNSPGRMWWESEQYFYNSKMTGLYNPLLHYFRIWDATAASRPDIIIANSAYVVQKIKKYWQREASVLHPFISAIPDPDKIVVPTRQNYFLLVSRLVAWKRIDLVIDAFNQLNYDLVIVGDGPQRKSLQKQANKNIYFTGYLTELEKHGYYHNCKGFIHPQVEDFGLTPLEAMAWGKGVIAYGQGGALETVTAETGTLFTDRSVSGIIEAVKKFERQTIDMNACLSRAASFSKEAFYCGFQEVLKNNGII